MSETTARSSRRRSFLIGALCAVLAMTAVQWAINQSTIPDRLVSPLLLAETHGNADAIVVLGAGVVGGCGVNLNGVRRVLLAVREWRKGRAPFLVFTGASDVPSCPVSVAMAHLATEIGVPESSIHVETASRSTRENAELTAPLLRSRGARRLLIVTDRLHMRRASAAFAQLGFEIERASVPVYEGHVNNVAMLSSGVREIAALFYYRVRGWVESGNAMNPAPSQRETAVSSRSDMQVSNPSGPLVVLGASYAGGWKFGPVAGMPVINQGVAGQQSFEMLERFERDVVAVRPRAVILWGFINDIFRAHGDVDAVVARTRETYMRMIALARLHGIEPMIATEVTIRPPSSWMNALGSIVGALRGKESYQALINRHVIETNRWLVDVARRENLLLLDLQSTLSEGGGTRRAEFTQDDGSHISPAGYATLTAYATPILERHFAARAGAARPQ
jgi:uncharacterized SAM-binding protein YcdF (DUF218 family)/lysophospholipase L1-like esterase